MSADEIPPAIRAIDVPVRRRPSFYPEPFASQMVGREKRALGDLFGLKNFGVNLTRLAPGATSSLRHTHSRQDEMVYVLEGHPTLVTERGRTPLAPGMCAGFAAGAGDAHHLVNETREAVLYLEIGDRSAEDDLHYPDDDLKPARAGDRQGWLHKDDTPY